MCHVQCTNISRSECDVFKNANVKITTWFCFFHSITHFSVYNVCMERAIDSHCKYTQYTQHIDMYTYMSSIQTARNASTTLFWLIDVLIDQQQVKSRLYATRFSWRQRNFQFSSIFGLIYVAVEAKTIISDNFLNSGLPIYKYS